MSDWKWNSTGEHLEKRVHVRDLGPLDASVIGSKPTKVANGIRIVATWSKPIAGFLEHHHEGSEG